MEKVNVSFVDIAEVCKNIAIAQYALVRIGDKIESDDVDAADQAIAKTAHIMNKILDEICKQDRAEKEKKTMTPKEHRYFLLSRALESNYFGNLTMLIQSCEEIIASVKKQRDKYNKKLVEDSEAKTINVLFSSDEEN